jgi:hypothetical protein
MDLSSTRLKSNNNNIFDIFLKEISVKFEKSSMDPCNMDIMLYHKIQVEGWYFTIPKFIFIVMFVNVFSLVLKYNNILGSSYLRMLVISFIY